jgi:uncharacterized membrane protein
MYCGHWQGYWGYPYYPWGIIGIVFHLTVLALIIWAVVTVVKSLTSHKQVASKDGGAK